MPSTAQRALPRFPAAIVGVGAISVSIANGVATISQTSNPDTNPTVSQYLRALTTVQANGVSTLQSSVAASPDDPNRVILDYTRTVLPGGAFEILVQSTFGFSAATMTALRALALLQIA